MTRLPFVAREDLGETGVELWDAITSSRGPVARTEEGGLAGPFNAWVTAPEVGTRLVDLGGHLRFGTSLERRLTEIAIITVGARWRSEFEWWAHARMAREHGVADHVVDAIGRGDEPTFDRDDERVVHAVAARLARDGRIDRATYDPAVELLGDVGMVELVTLCGYYTLVSLTLNAFDVALPPGEEPTWGG